MHTTGQQEQIIKQHEPINITEHREPIHETEQHEPIQDHTRAEEHLISAQQMEANQTLVQNAVQQLPEIHAQRTAAGTPIQDVPVEQRTWKERQQDKRHAKAARRESPLATAVSYDIRTQLTEDTLQRGNAVRAKNRVIEESGVDDRVLMCYCQGYRVDKRGAPAKREDRETKAKDDAFIEDYCSRDLERRKPHLERMVAELLAVECTEDMFEQRSLRRNAAQLRSISQRMVAMDNVMADPINRPFFEQMRPDHMARLRNLITTMHQPFVNLLTCSCKLHAVSANSGAYYQEQDVVQDAQQRMGTARQWYQTAAAQLTQHNRAADQTHARQAGEWASDYARRMAQNKAALERVKADPRLGLRDGEANSQFLSRAVMLMNTDEGAQEENLNTVQTTLAMGRLQGDELPSRELYSRARTLLAPRVQRVLDCNVEELAALSDEHLMQRGGELNAMFMDTMFVSDLLRTKHHCQKWGDGTPMTLGDDILDHRANEYAYKQNILRGLAERARGLAMQRAAEFGLLDQTYLTSAELLKVQDGTLEAFAAKRIQTGDTVLTAAKKRWENLHKPGSQEMRDWLTDLLQKGAQQRYVLSDRFLDVSNELYARATPEIDAVMKRVHDERYYSITSTEAQTEAKGCPLSIGEPIFRSFESFAAYEATQKLLTPEQFRQMVMQIGAGAGLHNGVWSKEESVMKPGADGKLEPFTERIPQEGSAPELLAPAIEANKQGLATFKTVLKAQYDMLYRKYGRSLENLSLPEYLEHYSDFAHDFTNAQVDLSMASRHPDFLDPANPEDVELRRRIEYFSVIGNTSIGLLGMVQSGVVTNDAELQSMYVLTLNSQADCAAAREKLTEQEGFVRERIDWTQKVRVPGEDAAPNGGR